MKKLSVILNPAAGRGNAAKIIPLIQQKIKELPFECRLLITEKPGHAVELARKEAENKVDMIAAVGGDGTSNEVLNGILSAKTDAVPALAVLCAGRGNDFAFGAGIPIKLETDIDILAHGTFRVIDAGRVRVDDGSEWRYFGNGIGMGFDAVVGFEAAKMKRLSGFPSYLAAAFKTLSVFKNPPLVRITVDDLIFEEQAMMVSVMNGRRMGGGFLMAPDGDPSDGLLDICTVGHGSTLELLGLIGAFTKGAQMGKKQVRFHRTRKITIEALEGTLPAHADGETLCEAGNKLEIELIPQAVKILAP